MASALGGGSDIVDYRELEDDEITGGGGVDGKEGVVSSSGGLSVGGVEKSGDSVGVGGRGNYVAIETSGFRDFYLKPELIRAIGDAGFEHPSEVQHEAIPHAITGVDILCQAKSGMGKTAVFVLSVLHQLDMEGKEDAVYCLVLGHARELAFQIKNEFDRFRKHMSDKIRCDVFYGGVSIQRNVEVLQDPNRIPHILIGTPGRILALIRKGYLDTSHINHFILDECDKCLEKLDMRKDVQDIFVSTPKNKQVMMFSATLSGVTTAATAPAAAAAAAAGTSGSAVGSNTTSSGANKTSVGSMKDLCRRYMSSNLYEIIIDDDDTKLTLNGLMQFYYKLNENNKNRILSELLDKLEFNQTIIFVKTINRASALDKLLNECGFPSISIHAGLSQTERIETYQKFKNFEKRIMVATDLFGRGIDIERVNIVFNYDMPDSTDAYLHRVGRAGRFGTKGLAITFVASEEDSTMLNDVQARFEVKVDEMPEFIDSSCYINQ